MVKEVTMPQLATYELYPYFFLNNPSQGVVFSAPAQGGATTPNSDNARSEIRVLHEWSNRYETWNMEAVLAFLQIPISSDPTRGNVGMQIHDGVDDVTVLRLEKNGDLWVTKGDTTHFDILTGSYVMGTYMRVRVTAKRGGGIDWYMNNMTTPVATVPGVYSGCYHKFGAYCQTGPGATGQAVTAFKSCRWWKS